MKLHLRSRYIVVVLAVLLSIVTAPLGHHGTYAVHAAESQKPFKYQPSQAVQKGFDLLAKYKLPGTMLGSLVSILNDSKKLTDTFKALKTVKLTDTQIADLVKA